MWTWVIWLTSLSTYAFSLKCDDNISSTSLTVLFWGCSGLWCVNYNGVSKVWWCYCTSCQPEGTDCRSNTKYIFYTNVTPPTTPLTSSCDSSGHLCLVKRYLGEKTEQSWRLPMDIHWLLAHSGLLRHF